MNCGGLYRGQPKLNMCLPAELADYDVEFTQCHSR